MISGKTIITSREPIIVRCEQGTDEWRGLRTGIPSASMFEKIMSPVKCTKSSQQKAYAAKLAAMRCGWSEPRFETAAMTEGIEREPEVVAAYCVATGSEVDDNVGFVYGDSSLSYGCSPDGLVGDDGGLECKYPQLNTLLEWRYDSVVPSKHLSQVNGSLFITAREWWDFCAYNEDHEPFIVRVHRDDEQYQKWEKKFVPILRDFVALVEAMVPDWVPPIKDQLEASLEMLGVN